jgi:hypothetical protein
MKIVVISDLHSNFDALAALPIVSVSPVGEQGSGGLIWRCGAAALSSLEHRAMLNFSAREPL